MELRNKCDAVEKTEAEKRQLSEKKHQEELQALRKTNQQLKVLLSPHSSLVYSACTTWVSLCRLSWRESLPLRRSSSSTQDWLKTG